MNIVIDIRIIVLERQNPKCGLNALLFTVILAAILQNNGHFDYLFFNSETQIKDYIKHRLLWSLPTINTYNMPLYLVAKENQYGQTSQIKT
jgi:hypothetical protein